MTAVELRAELQQRDVSTSGTKAELAARLTQALEEESHEKARQEAEKKRQEQQRQVQALMSGSDDGLPPRASSSEFQAERSSQSQSEAQAQAQAQAQAEGQEQEQQPSLAERIAGLSKLRMAELKAELQQFDLDTSGSKADLIERLSARLKAAAALRLSLSLRRDRSCG